MTAAPLLSYYGDDLTGSTDAMEALELHGVPTVLFTDLPAPGQAERFAGRRAVGIAGTSRSRTPEWMDENLPAVFAWLRGLGAHLCHYKVCSTFDSSPAVGSIGRAIDIGAAAFGQSATLLVVGAPQLKRYTAFGHLFAGFRGRTYRIDRHPVMSRHPVTPMAEADLAVHLSHQTAKRIGLVDLSALARADASALVERAMDEAGIVLLDVADEATQGIVGRELWRLAPRAPFVVGSSGVEYAIVSDASGSSLSGGAGRFPPPGPSGPIAAVSGSVSPTTERQIRHAVENGFGGVAVDVAALGGTGSEAAIEAAVEAGSRHLSDGRSVVLHTALGPDSLHHGAGGVDGEAVGTALGGILDRLVRRHALKRACVSGGDTSSHAIRRLGLFALECLYPLPNSPGSPLCRASGEDPAVNGLEIAFKGGQVGTDDYFCQVREG